MSAAAPPSPRALRPAVRLACCGAALAAAAVPRASGAQYERQITITARASDPVVSRATSAVNERTTSDATFEHAARAGAVTAGAKYSTQGGTLKAWATTNEYEYFSATQLADAWVSGWGAYEVNVKPDDCRPACARESLDAYLHLKLTNVSPPLERWFNSAYSQGGLQATVFRWDWATQAYTEVANADLGGSLNTHADEDLLQKEIADRRLLEWDVTPGRNLFRLALSLRVTAVNGATADAQQTGTVVLNRRADRTYTLHDGFLSEAQAPDWAQAAVVAPEPSTFALLGAGALGLGAAAARRRRAG